MTLLRRLAYASVAVAFLHIVFGAIVRITGSGMGCGDNWPTCYGYWIPPFDRPDLIIEVTHRYLALLLLVAIAALAVAAWMRRGEAGVGGRGGVLRTAGLALLLWIAPALLGALTVFLGNPPAATVAHKALAATLLAVLAVAAIRAGGFGARGLAGAAWSGRARRGAIAAAAMALVVVLLGALTAKLPGAAVACGGFPFCSETRGEPGLAHVQLTHRILAYLLALHLLGLAIGYTRRREPRPLLLASRAAVGLVVVQIMLAAHMVLGGFPAVVRSAHQATGMAIWLTTFVLAYLASRGGDAVGARARDARPRPAAPAPARPADIAPAPASMRVVPPAPVAHPAAPPAASAAPEEPAIDERALEDEEVEEAEDELDLEIARDLERRAADEEREAEERAEFQQAVEREMAKVAEELVVADTPTFVEALETAVTVAASTPPAEPTAATPAAPEAAAEAAAAPEPAEGEAPAEAPAQPPRPRKLSMAVIVARGADF